MRSYVLFAEVQASPGANCSNDATSGYKKVKTVEDTRKGRRLEGSVQTPFGDGAWNRRW